MTPYRCDICSVFEYEEVRGNSITNIKPGTSPEDFPDGWKCPICSADKTHLVQIKEETTAQTHEKITTCPKCGATTKISISHYEKSDLDSYLGEWKRSEDEVETHMADIHRISATGEPIIEAMRTGKNVISWEDILMRF